MRCILCTNISFHIICKKCQSAFLQPHTSIRILDDGFKVYSFYKYKDIEALLKTKHTHIGAKIYRILAQNSFSRFKNEFSFGRASILPIDDIPKSGYAHTAILARALQNNENRVYYRTLRARNKINYSGKSLAYRLEHPRDFIFDRKRVNNIILVDDIITTGTTVLEAKKVVEKSGQTPMFALTLADARDL